MTISRLTVDISSLASTDLSSHLICTQPGLRMNDHGWYHFSTTSTHEHNVSSHRCSTCSLYASQHNINTTSLPWEFSPYKRSRAQNISWSRVHLQLSTSFKMYNHTLFQTHAMPWMCTRNTFLMAFSCLKLCSTTTQCNNIYNQIRSFPATDAACVQWKPINIILSQVWFIPLADECGVCR